MPKKPSSSDPYSPRFVGPPTPQVQAHRSTVKRMLDRRKKAAIKVPKGTSKPVPKRKGLLDLPNMLREAGGLVPDTRNKNESGRSNERSKSTGRSKRR